MRAVIHERYGPPEVLRVGDVERPVPEVDEVLVEVHASTVTRGDAMGVRSEDYRFTRVFTGIRTPTRKSAFTVAVNVPASSMPSRLNPLNPGSVNVTL